MKVLAKGIMEDGTKIQIEDWSEDYSFMTYGTTLASYPKSKQTLKGGFSPKLNETYRFSFNFKNNEEAKQAMDGLLLGEKTLLDFKELIDIKDHAVCL